MTPEEIEGREPVTTIEYDQPISAPLQLDRDKETTLRNSRGDYEEEATEILSPFMAPEGIDTEWVDQRLELADQEGVSSDSYRTVRANVSDVQDGERQVTRWDLQNVLVVPEEGFVPGTQLYYPTEAASKGLLDEEIEEVPTAGNRRKHVPFYASEVDEEAREELESLLTE